MKCDRLIKPIADKYLVIMPYHPDKYGDVRLTLNLWKKFCTFNYEFVVIGDYDPLLEKEFKWVTFIYCNGVKSVPGQYTSHIDVQHKYEMALNMYSSKYHGFIRMMDDNYAVKPFNADDILTIHYHKKEFTGDKYKPVSFWIHDMWKTRQLLDKENLPHVNYSTHFPFYFEFSKLQELWNKYDMHNNSYSYESLYFNYYTHEDPMIDSDIRYCIHTKEEKKIENLNKAYNSNIKFMFTSNEGWSRDVGNWLRHLL